MILSIILCLLIWAAEPAIGSLEIGKQQAPELAIQEVERSSEMNGLRLVFVLSSISDYDSQHGDTQSSKDLENDLRSVESFIASTIESLPLLRPLEDLSQCEIKGKDFQADMVVLVSFARIGDNPFLFKPCLFDQDLHLLAGSLILSLDIGRQEVKTALKIGTLALLNASQEFIDSSSKGENGISKEKKARKELESFINSRNFIAKNDRISKTKGDLYRKEGFYSNNNASKAKDEEISKELKKLENSRRYKIQWKNEKLREIGKRKLAACDENCATCNADGVTCDQCADGFVDDGDVSCTACDPSCETCSGSTAVDCIACAGNKLLSGTDCVDNCPDGTFEEGSSCSSCVSPCVNCDISAANCLTCETASTQTCCPDGRYFTDLTCSDCPTGCTLCSAATTCTDCEDKYYLTITNSCITCSDSICKACPDNTCSTCVENAVLVDGTCECNTGYYKSSGSCVKLCDLCVSCNENSVCACVEYASFVTGETNPENLCACSDSEKIGNICVPTGDYYTENSIIDRIEFITDFLELAVYFKSSPTYVDIADPSSCSEYFQTDTLDKLGAFPSCDRAQSGTVITVILGFQYTLRKGDSMNLYWLHIRNSRSSISTNFVNLSGIATGGQYPTPNVIITGPASIYLSCGQTSFDFFASVVRGAANNLLAYQWLISPNLLTPLATQELLQSSVTILNTAFGSVSEDYSISVTVTNVFGVSGTTSTTLSVLKESGISISFAGGSFFQIRSDETREVEAIARDRCGETEPVSYVWSFENTESGIIPSGTTIISLFENKRLRIQERSHAANETYNYRCTATSGSTSGFAILTFKVIYSEPIALMNIENGTISNSKTLELDGSESYDPSNQAISYLWTCIDQNSSVCLSTRGTNLFSPVDRSVVNFSIPGSDLILGSVLSIYLAVSTTDNRIAVQNKIIEVVDGGNISIKTVPIVQKILAHRHLIVYLDILNGSTVEWSQIPLQSLSISSKLTDPYLWIQPLEMEEGESYTFQATVTDSIGKSMYVQISWTTNKGPTCGGKLKNTSTSERLIEMSIEDCYDRDEDDVPLKYGFGAVWEGFILPSVYRTLSSNLEIWSLPGTKQLAVFVCDRLGSCITKVSTVTVNKDRVLNDETNIQTDFIEAKHQNSDLVPFAVLDSSSAYNLIRTEWEFLFQELSDYTASLLAEVGIFDELTVSTLMGTNFELLTEYFAMSTSHVIQGIDYILNLIHNAEYKLTSLDLELVAETILGLATNYAFDNVIFLRILDLQAEVNGLQLKGGPPIVTAFNFQSCTPGFVASTQRIVGEDLLNSYSISASVGSKTYSFSSFNITQVLPEDVIDVDLTVIPFPLYSDSVTVDFYKAGTYNKETLELILQDERTPLSLQNLENSINITIPFAYNETLSYGVYALRDNEWVYDEGVSLLAEETGLTIQTLYLSSFQIREVILEAIIPLEEDEDCSWHFAPLIFQSASVLTSGVLIVLACRVESKKKTVVSTTMIRGTYEEVKTSQNERNLSPGTKDEDIFERNKAIENLPKETNEIARNRDIDSEKERDIVRTRNRNRDRNRDGGGGRCGGLKLFLLFHPILGQLTRRFSPVVRAFEVGLSLMLNLLIVGLFLSGFETATDYKEQVNPEKYLIYGLFSSLVSFLIILTIEVSLLFERTQRKWFKRLRLIGIGMLFLGCEGVSSLFTAVFCESWSIIWTVVSVFGLCIEWFVFYSLYTIIAFLIAKSN